MTRSTRYYLEVGETAFDALASPKYGACDSMRGASLFTLLLATMPRMATSMAWSAQWAALGPYLGPMLPKTAVQLTQIIAPLTGILVGPIIGAMSDRSTNKWGRRRPFILSAGVLTVGCWIAMGYTQQIGEALGDYGTGRDGKPSQRTWTAVFAVFFFTWMDITVNIVQTPVILLVADIAGDRQTTGAAFGEGWDIFGSLIVSIYMQIWGQAYLTLHTFLGMLSVVMAISVIIVCFLIKEQPRAPAPTTKPSTVVSIGEAFYSIYAALLSLPYTLVVYGIIFFCATYGFTAYEGGKEPFFGFEVFHGDSVNAFRCAPECSKAQKDYSRGIQFAGDTLDIIGTVAGCVFSFVLPLLVHHFGAKRVLTVSLLPQSCLIIMAFFYKILALDAVIVVLATVSQNVVFALVVPFIIHVVGDETDVGVYIGALNSASSVGQLLNLAVGSALFETSMGYRLPVLVGGIMGFVGLVVSAILLRVKLFAV